MLFYQRGTKNNVLVNILMLFLFKMPIYVIFNFHITCKNYLQWNIIK